MKIALIIIVLIIFPIFVKSELFFCKKNKKLFFCFKIFSFLRIIFGEISANSNGLIINLNYKKNIIYPYKNFINIKEKIKPLRDYHLLKCKILFKIGVCDMNEGIIIASAFQSINEIINSLLREIKPYIKLKNIINIYEDSDDKNAFISLTFVFNLLTVILGIIKKFWGKLLIWKAKITD